MKFVIVSTYEDKESYCHSIITRQELDVMVRGMRERGCQLVTLEELNHECWLQHYGDNVLVLIPADAEAKAYLPGLVAEEAERGHRKATAHPSHVVPPPPTLSSLRIDVKTIDAHPRPKTTVAVRADAPIPLPRVFVNGREARVREPQRPFSWSEWGTARARFPFPRSQS
jgi:hypothetical protein